MRSRNRITSPSRPSKKKKASRFNQSNEEPFSKILSVLMEKCSLADVDPLACVPLCLVRKIQANAVQKLKLILTGKSKNPSILLLGFMSGSPTSIVIPLVDELRYLLYEYWSSILESKEEVEERIKMHPTWYGVIDGCQLHAAIVELREEIPEVWSGFRWKVTVLRHTSNVNDLRKLARAQNERNKEEYTFNLTIYDLLHGLRVEHDFLLNRKKKDSREKEKTVVVSSREVAIAAIRWARP